MDLKTPLFLIGFGLVSLLSTLLFNHNLLVGLDFIFIMAFIVIVFIVYSAYVCHYTYQKVKEGVQYARIGLSIPIIFAHLLIPPEVEKDTYAIILSGCIVYIGILYFMMQVFMTMKEDKKRFKID